MSIAYARHQVISRSTGRSIVACAAYRAGEELHDARQDKTHRYELRRGIQATGILTPNDAPDWMHDREELWNAVERREDRSKRHAEAQLAREVVIALPHELTDEDRHFLIKNILKNAATRKGMIADYAIHAPDSAGDERNYHAHVLLTMRTINPDDPDGFGKKVRAWNDKTELQAFKQIVERETNKMLARRGIEERISFAETDQEPSMHLGHAVNELERRGIRTDAGDYNREVQARNDTREAIAIEREQIERELKTLDRAERLAQLPAVQDIGWAYAAADSGSAFVHALEEKNLLLARVTQAEAVMSQHRHEAAQSRGHYAPIYEAGQYVAVTKQGQVFALDHLTVYDAPENIAAKLRQIDPAKQLTLTQAREVMDFWRGDRDATPFERPGPSALATAKTMAGRVGHGLDGVARLGDIAFHRLGDVLDYLFGGIAGTAQQLDPDRTAQPDTHDRPPAEKDINRTRLSGMERTDLTDPATQEFIQSQGIVHEDLQADLRRQIEEAKKRDRDRDR